MKSIAIFSLLNLIYGQSNDLDMDSDNVDNPIPTINTKEHNRHMWQQTNMVNQLLESQFPLKKDMKEYIWRYGCYCHRNDAQMASSSNNYHAQSLEMIFKWPTFSRRLMV